MGEASKQVDHSCPPWNPRNETDPEKMIKQIGVCDDHIQLHGKVPVFRVSYFDEVLKDAPSFWGHVPRWYVPHTPIEYPGVEYDLTVTLMIINQVKENYVDVGFDWSPFALGKGEIMI